MILDKFFGRSGGQVSKSTTVERLNLPTKFIHSAESTAEKLSVVDRCTNVLSDSMSKMPSYVLQTATRDRPQLPILDLLNLRPNEAMTASVLWKAVEIARLTQPGGGFVWIIRDRLSETPRELIHIPSRLVEPWRDTKGKVWYDISHPFTGDRMRLPSEDVLHYKCYSPDGLSSIPVLQRASQVIQAGLAAQAYHQTYYESGGQPAGVLTADTDLGGYVKDKNGKNTEVLKKDALRKEWERVHRGPSNSHRIAILDHGLKYTPITASMADTQFVETHDVTILDICNFFGVPAYKVNAGKQSYSSNEQNAIEYVTGTLHPIVLQYEQEDTWKLLLPSERRKGLALRRNMLAELRGDYDSRGRWYQVMHGLGAYSPNDILMHEELPNVPGGDVRMASLNVVPLEDFRELSRARNAPERSDDDGRV